MGGYAEEGFPLYYINDQMLSCLGYTMQEFLEATGGRMTGCIHPKDRIQAERAAQKCAAQDEICAVRCRMVKKDGGVLGRHSGQTGRHRGRPPDDFMRLRGRQ